MRWRDDTGPVSSDTASAPLGERATTDLDALIGSCVLAVPLGSTEQHGPHLPLATDTLIAAALVERVASSRPDVLAAPALPYGSSATAMLDASAAIYGLDDVEAFAGGSRIGRLIDPDEIASAIAWLCTESPGALTGAVLDVDGGFRP